MTIPIDTLIERWTNLLRVLNEVKTHHKAFNMEQWSPRDIAEPVVEWTCKTACCAGGWAGRDKWFNEQGFTLVKADDLRYHVFVPTYRDATGFSACSEFFGSSSVFTPERDGAPANWDGDGDEPDEHTATLDEVIADVEETLTNMRNAKNDDEAYEAL